MIDERLNAFRPDLCDKALNGQFIADRYVTPTLHFIVASQCPVFGNAALTGGRITTFVLGEAVHCFEQKEGVAWVQSLRDRYVGYIDASVLSSKNDATVPPSHYVHSAGCFIYEDANIKSQALYYAPMTALLNASERIFDKEGQAWAVCKISETEIGYCHAQNLSLIGSWQKEPFKKAQQVINYPYLWGGGSHAGYDCSQLIQQAFWLCGILLPRDSDLQQKCGGSVEDGDYKANDLIFWQGHVGIMVNHETMLHANARDMRVAEWPVKDAIDRFKSLLGLEVITHRRITKAQNKLKTQNSA